jgi:hypothetical protein
MTTTGTSAGEALARGLLAKDWAAVVGVLDADVDFRGLTPGRQWEANSARQVVDEVFTTWLEPTDEVYEVLDVTTDSVVNRERVVYRFRVRNPDGDYVCEQTAYYDVGGGHITKLRVLCSGFLPSGGDSN